MEEALDLSFDRLLMTMMMMMIYIYIYRPHLRKCKYTGTNYRDTTDYMMNKIPEDKAAALISFSPLCVELDSLRPDKFYVFSVWH